MSSSPKQSRQQLLHANALPVNLEYVYIFALHFASFHIPLSPPLLRYNISWAVDSHTPIEEYKLSFRKLPQGHEVVDNAIDSQSSSSSSTSLSSSSSSQMYGSSTHNHRMGNNLANYGGYGNLMHWGHNDWRNVVLPSFPLSHHYTQGMSYMVRGLDPDQQYEATVQSR